MSARWAALTEYLRTRDGDVVMSWTELDSVVGGMPDSAQNHFPQWWHGDRSNTRAWRAAGYEATQIHPGVSVRFVRSSTGDASPESMKVPTPVQDRPAERTAGPYAAVSGDGTMLLDRLDPTTCLVVIPCSKTKRSGGTPGAGTEGSAELQAARRSVLDQVDTSCDESRLRPAWRRYAGSLYTAATPAIRTLALDNRLVILSGGYGVLDGSDLIGDYDRIMKARDWPVGLLERTLATRAAQSELDVVAFVAATTDYAGIVRRAPWLLPAGRSVHLATMKGVRGGRQVSASLGRAIASFMQRDSDYPPGLSVERIYP